MGLRNPFRRVNRENGPPLADSLRRPAPNPLRGPSRHERDSIRPTGNSVPYCAPAELPTSTTLCYRVSGSHSTAPTGERVAEQHRLVESAGDAAHCLYPALFAVPKLCARWRRPDGRSASLRPKQVAVQVAGVLRRRAAVLRGDGDYVKEFRRPGPERCGVFRSCRLSSSTTMSSSSARTAHSTSLSMGTGSSSRPRRLS